LEILGGGSVPARRCAIFRSRIAERVTTVVRTCRAHGVGDECQAIGYRSRDKPGERVVHVPAIDDHLDDDIAVQGR
jgi:hypothetical protein